MSSSSSSPAVIGDDEVNRIQLPDPSAQAAARAAVTQPALSSRIGLKNHASNAGRSNASALDDEVGPAADNDAARLRANQMLTELNGLLDDIDVLSEKQFIDAQWHCTKTALGQVSYSLGHNMAMDTAVKLANVRNALGIYGMNIDRNEAADDGELTEANARALTADFKQNQTVYVGLRKAAEGIFATVEQQIIRSGHHYIQQYNGPFMAIVKYMGITLGNITPDLIFHKAIHPVGRSELNRGFGARSTIPTVRKRSRVIPAGFSWLAITKAVFDQIAHMPYGDAIRRKYSNHLAVLDQAVAMVADNAYEYSDSYMGGKKTLEDLLSNIDRNVSEVDMQSLCAIASAWVFVYADVKIGSASFIKYGNTQQGLKELWKSAFRFTKRNMMKDVFSLCSDTNVLKPVVVPSAVVQATP